MNAQAIRGRRKEEVSQFSIFTANRLGRLHDLVALLSTHGVDVLAITVLDTSDSAIIRVVVDDPDKARQLLEENHFPYTESPLLVIELESATRLNAVMAALLEAELNINYLYCFIPHPHGKSILAISMEDNELAEQVLAKHAFKVLKQTDISR